MPIIKTCKKISEVKTRVEDLMIALQSLSERWQPSACGLVCSWSFCNDLM